MEIQINISTDQSDDPLQGEEFEDRLRKIARSNIATFQAKRGAVYSSKIYSWDFQNDDPRSIDYIGGLFEQIKSAIEITLSP